MSIKRILSLLMVLVLSFSIMACGADTDVKTPDTTEPTDNTDNKDEADKNNEEKEEVELVISAAASLTDAMGEIGEMIKKDKNIVLTVNPGSSGALQKQIEEGAPSDVFISAGQKQMDELGEKDLIEKESRIDILKNQLVLIVPQDNKEGIKTIQDVVDKKVQIAIGETETVPVGQYSKKALEALKLWDKLDVANIIQSKDVREVLTHVEEGNVSAGLVYSSDAVVGEKVEQVEVFSEDLAGPIVYPAAIVSESKEKDAGQIFLDYLKTKEVQDIFVKYGFGTL